MSLNEKARVHYPGLFLCIVYSIGGSQPIKLSVQRLRHRHLATRNTHSHRQVNPNARVQ